MGIIRQGHDGPIARPGHLDEGFAQAVRIASLCNVSTYAISSIRFIVFAYSLYSVHKNLRGEWKSTGDPTEVALQVFATKLGLDQPSLVAKPTSGDFEKVAMPDEKVAIEETQDDKPYKLITEFPFSSSVKRMTTIYSDTKRPEELVGLLKGAVRLVVDFET